MDDLKETALHQNIGMSELAHLLQALCRTLVDREPVTGFIDLLSLQKVLPDNFFHLKDDVQLAMLYKAVHEREHAHETILSRFSFANPYLICWLPESEAEALERA